MFQRGFLFRATGRSLNLSEYKAIVNFSFHIVSVSRSCYKCYSSIVDVIAMHTMVSSANSHIMDFRPTDISLM